MRVVLRSTGEELELDAVPVAGGGEAIIYAVVDRPNVLAKVYHKPTPAHSDKLAAMLAAPPNDPMAGKSHVSIAWPIDRLLSTDDRRVVGFLMPRIEQARTIMEFYNPKARLLRCPQFHYGYLLRTAHNLAAAMRAVHTHGHVIGDVNESNILTTAQALVTLVDTDSFQVVTRGRVFRCLVGKAEYTPPELQGASFADVDRTPQHDAFGLGVLIFQLLMQGNHPFAGRPLSAGEPPPVGRRIAEGHWPYAKTRSAPYLPNPHAPPFDVLPPPVQELMMRCFDAGHERPLLRPTAAVWQRALQEAERELTTCTINSQHVHHGKLAACPWCVMTRIQGRDPFPARVTKAQGREGEGEKGRDGGGEKGREGDKRATVSPSLPLSSSPPLSRWQRLLLATAQQFHSSVWPWLLVAGAGMALALGIAIMLRRPGSPGPTPELRLREIGRLIGHEDDVQCVAFSPDGLHALSGSSDGTARWWDVQSGKEIHCFKGHRESIFSVAISPDGRRALTGSKDTTVRGWNLVLGDGPIPLGRHESAVQSVAFIPGRELAVSTGGDQKALFWPLPGERRTPRPLQHEAPVWAVAVAPDGEQLATGDSQGRIRLWDIRTGKRLQTYEGHTGLIHGLTFAAHGSRLLSGSWDGSLRLWDVESGEELQHMTGHSDMVLGVAVTPDSRAALSVGYDGTFRIWDLETGRELHRIDCETKTLECVACSPDGRHALVGGDKVLTLWQLPTLPPSTLPEPANQEVLVGQLDDVSRPTWLLVALTAQLAVLCAAAREIVIVRRRRGLLTAEQLS